MDKSDKSNPHISILNVIGLERHRAHVYAEESTQKIIGVIIRIIPSFASAIITNNEVQTEELLPILVIQLSNGKYYPLHPSICSVKYDIADIVRLELDEGNWYACRRIRIGENRRNWRSKDRTRDEQ